MRRARICRRTFLSSCVAAAGGLLFAGCGEAEKEVTVIKQEDPSLKAKESMDYYKNNVLNKKQAKK